MAKGKAKRRKKVTSRTSRKTKFSYVIRVTVKTDAHAKKKDIREWVQDCFDMRADERLSNNVSIIQVKAGTVDEQ